MSDPSFLRTLEHDEGALRAEDRLSSPARRGPLRPATAELCDHGGLRSSARLKTGADTRNGSPSPRHWLPRRARRGWFFAELLRLPRIVRQRPSEGLVPPPGTGRARRASAERPAPGSVSGSLPVGAES